MTTVFLSYRRNDTKGDAARLSDALRLAGGKKMSFRDIRDIPIGLEFDRIMESALNESKFVLVLVGPRWLTELKTRMALPGIDYVRCEVATALKMQKRVIPILIDGAVLPTDEELPPDLKPLTKRQTITLRDESWQEDFGRLMDAIGRPYSFKNLAIRMVAAAIGILVGIKLALPFLPDRVATDIIAVWTLLISSFVIYLVWEAIYRYRYIRKRS